MGRKVFLVSVTSSIIASIAFAWLLDPVTRWIWHTASDSAWSWFVNLQAAAFRNAALGKREWLSTALFIYVFTLVVIVLYTSPIGIGCGVLFGRLLRQKATDRTRQLIRGRVAPLTLVILSILMALSLTYAFGKIAFLAYVDLQLNASFSQRVDALSPYIDPMEERRLRSQWALMKSRADYEQINRRLDELATGANIQLPEPLLK